MVSRMGVIVALFALASVFTVSGYAIHNRSNTTAVTTSVELTLVEDDTDIDIRSEAALDPYFTHFFTLIGQVVVVAFLVPLTEDNSLKKSSINIVGVVTILLSYTCVMFLNLPVANVASPDIQYVDQIASEVGVSDNLSLAISVGGCLCVLLRGYFILLAVCRVVLHLVVVAEQQQGNSCCALLKVPHVVFGAQCAVLVGLVFIGKQQLSTLTLISLFLLMLCGAICHILHRYSTPVPSESRPILGSFGSLKSGRTVNILIIVLIISSTALASANVARNTISFESYLNGQLYATFSICIALAVIGTISLMASFQQQRYIHVFYKILLWTPIIPSAVIMLCCVALVYKWKWGCVAVGIVGIATITHAVAVWLGSKKLPEAGSSTASGSSESELGSVEDNGR